MEVRSQQAWKQFWQKTGSSSDRLSAIDCPEVSSHTYDAVCARSKYLLQLSDTDIVLNIGCGPGLFEEQIATQVKQIVGVDFASVMVEKARHANRVHTNAFFLQATGTALPFASTQFNKVLCYSVLHYFSEDEVLLLLREIRRVTFPDALVLLGDIEGEQEFATPISFDHIVNILKNGGVQNLVNKTAFRFGNIVKRRMTRMQRRWKALSGQFIYESKPQLLARYPRQHALAMAASVGFTGEVIEQGQEQFVGERYHLLLKV